MALTLLKRRIDVIFTDTGDNDTTRQLDLGTNDFPTAIQVSAIMATLQAVSTAKIKSYQLVEIIADDAFTLPANAQVEPNARLTLQIAGNPRKSATFDIPSPSPAIMVATEGDGLNQVALSNAGVQAVVDLFRSAGNFYISDGEKVADGVGAVKKGRRITKRSSKG